MAEAAGGDDDEISGMQPSAGGEQGAENAPALQAVPQTPLQVSGETGLVPRMMQLK